MLIRIFLTLILISPVVNALDSSIECVQSVCGTRNKASWSINPLQYASVKDVVEKSLKGPVSNYMGRVIRQNLITDQSFRSFLAMRDFPQVDPKFASMIVAFKYLGRLSEYAKALTLNDQNKYVIDSQKLKAQNPNLSAAEINAILTFNSFLNTIVLDTNYFKNAFPIALKLKYGGATSIQSGQIRLAKEILSAQEKMKAVFPVLKIFIGSNPAVNKALASLPLSEPEQAALSDAYLDSLGMRMATDETVLEQFRYIPLDLKALQVEVKSKFENSKLKPVFDKKPSIKGLYQEAYGKCMTYLDYSYAALPSRSAIQRFQQFLPAIEKIAQSIIEERKHVSLDSSFRSEYQFPMAQEDFVSNMTQIFNGKKEDMDSQMRNEVDLSAKDGFAIGLFIVTTYNDKNFLGEPVSLCEQMIPAPVDDASFSKAGVIKVGRVSILHPELGVAVIAHEYGHQVQAKFQSDINEELNCLRAIQGSDQYLNEDFADLFSAELVKRLGYDLNSVQLENIGCAINSSENESFTPDSLKNANVKDVHSSGLYRLIAFSSMTTGVTSQCQKVLNESNETRFNKYCRWK